MEQASQALFDYLSDALYRPAQASLNVEALPEEMRRLGEGLRFFVKCALETRAFATELSKGNINMHSPGRENELAAPLKALHASLRHLTWQSQQVAKGDYKQRLDFMGEFAEAFNTMTFQLGERQAALEGQIEKIRSQSEALSQSNSLLMALTEGAPGWIVVIDRETGEELFANRAARQGFERGGRFAEELRAWLSLRKGEGAYDFTGGDPDDRRYFSVSSYPLQWWGHDAVAYAMEDVSAERAYMHELESRAYSDMLTRLDSRYYGMLELNRWIEERRAFVLLFVDLDSLKYVNDTYGHGEGDRYIICAANAIRRLSKNGVYCRLGGDEFMVLVPDMGFEEVGRQMNAIRVQLAASSEDAAPRYPRGLSYGMVDVTRDNELSPSELLSLADERMYAFKRAHKRMRKNCRLPDAKNSRA